MDVVCDPANSLVKLADRIDWDKLDDQFAVLYSAEGRPAIATRMMVGLTLLQSPYSLSEDDVVNRWPENPYWQYLKYTWESAWHEVITCILLKLQGLLGQRPDGSYRLQPSLDPEGIEYLVPNFKRVVC